MRNEVGEECIGMRREGKHVRRGKYTVDKRGCVGTKEELEGEQSFDY